MMNLTWMPCVGRLLLLTQLTRLIAALTFDCRNGGGDRDVVFTFSFLFDIDFYSGRFEPGAKWKSSHLFRSNHMSPSIRLFEMNTTILLKDKQSIRLLARQRPILGACWFGVIERYASRIWFWTGPKCTHFASLSLNQKFHCLARIWLLFYRNQVLLFIVKCSVRLVELLNNAIHRCTLKKNIYPLTCYWHILLVSHTHWPLTVECVSAVTRPIWMLRLTLWACSNSPQPPISWWLSRRIDMIDLHIQLIIINSPFEEI